jgi:lysine N6-hydroxylase
MTYDIIGIGIGPFNLGLAALAADLPELTTIFFDEQPRFNWHPGLLLPTARMQVPYYADLVTLVQPQSRFSYFAFLHAQRRLFRFGIHENPFPLRREYNAYCQWVATHLHGCSFGLRCMDIVYDES